MMTRRNGRNRVRAQE